MIRFCHNCPSKNYELKTYRDILVMDLTSSIMKDKKESTGEVKRAPDIGTSCSDIVHVYAYCIRLNKGQFYESKFS